jgi:hypothetical protein
MIFCVMAIGSLTPTELVESFLTMAGYSVKSIAPTKIDDPIDFILGLENASDGSSIANFFDFLTERSSS